VADDLVMPTKSTLAWTLHWHDEPGTFHVYRGTPSGAWTYNHTCFAPSLRGSRSFSEPLDPHQRRIPAATM
jgi:hypothetical protein